MSANPQKSKVRKGNEEGHFFPEREQGGSWNGESMLVEPDVANILLMKETRILDRQVMFERCENDV